MSRCGWVIWQTKGRGEGEAERGGVGEGGRRERARARTLARTCASARERREEGVVPSLELLLEYVA